MCKGVKLRNTNLYKILSSENINYDNVGDIEKLITNYIINLYNIDNDKFVHYMDDKIKKYMNNFKYLLDKKLIEKCKMKYIKYKTKYINIKINI